MSRRRIALFIETSTAFGRGLLRGISRYARTKPDWELLFEPGGAEESFRQLKKWHPDGMLVRVHRRDMAKRILGAGVPVVDLGYVIPDLFPWSLSNDQVAVGRLAGQHFLDRGYSRFAFCGWGPNDPSAKSWERSRLQGFREIVDERGTVEVYRWPARAGERQRKHELPRLAGWLEGLPKPVAVFASNDMRAGQILSAAREASLRIPEDLALLGVDNDEVLCEVCSPTLSSIGLDLEGIGGRGAILLDGLLSGKKFDGEVIRVPPVGVVPRQSTDIVATDDQIIIDAVRFMRDHLDEGIGVADVVDAFPVSRKSFELRFKNALGRTPLAELTRQRIQHARLLLRDTDWPVKRISGECGFLYPENFHAAFRRAENETPGKWRSRMRSGNGRL